MYKCGTPGKIRTCDLELRSLLLYPTELRGHGAGWGSRNPVSSLENLHINRYTNPALVTIVTEVSIPDYSRLILGPANVVNVSYNT
jgi:hypothetical protein